MGVSSYKDLREHVGHEVVVVMYGEEHNVAIECETCNEVLLDFDNDEGGEQDVESSETGGV